MHNDIQRPDWYIASFSSSRWEIPAPQRCLLIKSQERMIGLRPQAMALGYLTLSLWMPTFVGEVPSVLLAGATAQGRTRTTASHDLDSLLSLESGLLFKWYPCTSLTPLSCKSSLRSKARGDQSFLDELIKAAQACWRGESPLTQRSSPLGQRVGVHFSLLAWFMQRCWRHSSIWLQTLNLCLPSALPLRNTLGRFFSTMQWPVPKQLPRICLTMIHEEFPYTYISM